MPKSFSAVVQMAFARNDPMPTAPPRLRKLAANGVALAVFPKAKISGSLKGPRFGAPFDLCKPHCRAAVARCRARAFAFCGANGLKDKHRNFMPTAGDLLLWGIGCGWTMPVLQTSLGTLDAVTFRKSDRPAVKTHPLYQGASLLGVHTFDERDTCRPTLQQMLMRRESANISSKGRVPAGPDISGETLPFSQKVPAKVMHANVDFDVTGLCGHPERFAPVDVAHTKSAGRER